MVEQETSPEQEAAEGVGIGVAFAVGVPLLAFLAIGLFDMPRGLRLGLIACAGLIASVGLGGALMSLAAYRSNPPLGDWGFAAMIAGVGGVLIAATALGVVGGAFGAVLTVLGFLFLLAAVIGAGLGGARWLTATPGSGNDRSGQGVASPPSPTSKRERIGIVFAFLQTVGTFIGLFLQA